MTFFLQACVCTDRLMIADFVASDFEVASDTNFSPALNKALLDGWRGDSQVDADSWIEAKKSFGFELTPRQASILEGAVGAA